MEIKLVNNTLSEEISLSIKSILIGYKYENTNNKNHSINIIFNNSNDLNIVWDFLLNLNAEDISIYCRDDDSEWSNDINHLEYNKYGDIGRDTDINMLSITFIPHISEEV